MSIPEYVDYYNASIQTNIIYVRDIVINPPGTKLYATCSSKIFSINIVEIDPLAYDIKTIAGSFANRGFNNGTGINAAFDTPIGLVMDTSGNVFVADEENENIRKIDTSGVVTTFAGDASGSKLHAFADSSGTNARFNKPQYLAIDSANNLYVTDSDNFRIRKITPAGIVTTLAGSGISGSNNGTGSGARFTNNILGITCNSLGNIYVAEGSKIRKITPSGAVTTAIDSSGANYTNLTSDNSGNIYASDSARSVIEKITADGSGSLLAGSYNNALAMEDPSNLSLNVYSDMDVIAKFNLPGSIAKHPNGDYFMLDTTAMMDGPYTALRKLTNITVVPTDISGITVTSVSQRSFSIAWTGGTYSRSYVFTLELNGGNPIETVPSIYNFHSKTATFNLLQTNSTYTVSVQGVNTYGSGEFLTAEVTTSGAFAQYSVSNVGNQTMELYAYD